MKTLIITDPCYIISDREWDGLCRNCFKSEINENQNEETKKFRDYIQELLKVISGDKQALANDTGSGDWLNEIDGQQFYADSGMVSICEYSEKLKNYLIKENIQLPIGVAYVDVDNNATYEIDTSNPNWSVVRIKSNGKEIHSLESEN